MQIFTERDLIDIENIGEKMGEKMGEKVGEKRGKDERELIIYRICSLRQNVEDSIK